MGFLNELNIPHGLGGIYKIENILNGKTYIGKSKEIRNRLSHHRGCALNGKKKFYIHNAIAYYGIHYFSVSVIEVLTLEQYNSIGSEREMYWIKYYHSNDREFGYNLTVGGEGAVGTKHSEEWKKEHSRRMSGSNNPNYHKHSRGRKVRCIETGEVYSSTRDAEKNTGIFHQGIAAACRGEYKQYKGFHWEYIL